MSYTHKWQYIIFTLLLILIFPSSVYPQAQTIDPRLLPNGVTRQTQIDGVNASGNDPLNFQQSTEIDPVDNGAGVIQWVLRNNSIADGRIISITTRSKLPAGIGYEDEANTWTLTQTFNGPVAIGSTGTFTIAGSSSGLITINRSAASGTYNFNLPATAGSAGQPLLSGGGAAAPMTFGTLGISGGGTGATSLTGSRCLRTNAGGTQIEVAASDCGTAVVDQTATYTWTGVHSIRDVNFSILGSVDQTKGIKFEVDGLPGGTVRTYTTPNANTALLGASDIGASVQAQNTNLAALSAQTGADGNVPFYTGPGAMNMAPSTSFGRGILNSANDIAARAAIGAPAASGTTLTGALTLSGVIRPAQITGNQNNYNPTGCDAAAVLYLTSDAPRNITGLACGQEAGSTKFIYNGGSQGITLVNDSGSSDADKRFAINANIVLGANQGIILQYDADPGSTVWRAASGISGGGGQPLDDDLTAIAGLPGTTGIAQKTAANIWALADPTASPCSVGSAPRGLNANLTPFGCTAYQTLDADLTTYAGITPSANTQTLLASADYAAWRTNLSLVIGTNVQAYSARLAELAALTPTANRILMSDASNFLYGTVPSTACDPIRYDPATRTFSCASYPAGTVSGTATKFAKFTGATAVGDSSFASEDGSGVTISGQTCLDGGTGCTNGWTPVTTGFASLISRTMAEVAGSETVTTGAKTTDNCAKWDASDRVVDAGAPCSGGSVSKSITILDPTAADTNKVQLYFSATTTLVRIACSTDTGTANINFDERAEATPNTAGVDTLGSALVCDNNSQTTTSFSDSSIAANVPYNLQIISVSGTPGVVRVHVTGTQ